MLKTSLIQVKVGDTVGYEDRRVKITSFYLGPNGRNSPEIVAVVNAVNVDGKGSVMATSDKFYALEDIDYSTDR